MLFTLPNFWPYVRRGSERLVHDLASEMTRRGHRVTVLTRGPGARIRKATMDGFDVIYVPTATRLFSKLRIDPVDGFALPAFVGGLLKSADVTCAFYPVDGVGLSLAARVRRRPFVISVHGWPELSFIQRRHPRMQRALAAGMRKAARVTVLSHGAALRMREEFGVGADVLYPGTFTATWMLPRPPTSRRTVVCSAAVDDPRKRVDLLVRAFLDVAKDTPDLDLLLVGPGDPSSALALVRELAPDVAPRVTHRFVESAELPEVFAGCTVGALTSERETFGLVVLEYLASGMPAVGSDDAGVPEILTPGTGALFSGDVAGCADALRRALALAADPSSVEACRARAADFDWSRKGDAHEELFLEAARSKARRA